MKIKQAVAQIILSIIVLCAAKTVVGGFAFSNSITYISMFLALFAGTDWVATRFRIFFLLPSMLPVPILLHSTLIGLLIYLASSIISGVTVTSLNPWVAQIIQDVLPRQEFGEFGTIVVVSLFCGTLYQLINWLYSEK
jgi:hypothetical protein